MLVGLSHTTINPDSGVLLGGYPTDSARRVTGIHDDLLATAISCRESDVDDHVVLLAFDGIAVPKGMTEMLNQEFGPGVSVVPVASHSHAAPAVEVWDQPIIGDFTPGYSEFLFAKSSECVADAIACEESALILAGKARLAGRVGTNRRSDNDVSDLSVRILEVRSTNGSSLALFVIYGCHPTVLGAENTEVSADLVWGIRQSIGQIPVAFLPGGAGNQSTRKTRLSPTYEECSRLGAILGDGVTAAREALELCTASRFSHELLDVEPRDFVGASEANRRVQEWSRLWTDLVGSDARDSEIRRAAVNLIGANHDLRRANAGLTFSSMQLPIAVWDLGSTAIAFWPVEPSYQLAGQLEDSADTWLCGYAGGYYGYLLDPDDFDEGGYEVAASPFQRDQAEVFLKRTQLMAAATA